MAENVDFGPFAPVAGYIGALIAAIYAIWTLAWRRKIWNTPQQLIPSNTRGLIGIVLAIGMVYFWLNITPGNLDFYISFAIWLAIFAVIIFITYYFILRILTYKMVIARENNKIDEVQIVGGLKLRNAAKSKMKANNVETIQELFKGAAYEADLLWSRSSQEIAKSLIILLYILIVVSGVLGLTITGLVTQVKLTNKAATETINKSESPGLSKE